jgi:outer membrane protein OmpA-like peptidoglycan-associated protein
MRHYIIGLSIFLFAMSGFIIVRTLSIPNQYSNSTGTDISLQTSKTTEHLQSNTPAAYSVQNNLNQTHENVSIPASTPAMDIAQPDNTETPPLSDQSTAEQQNNSLTLAVLGDSAFQADGLTLQTNMKSTLKDLSGAIRAFDNYRLIIEGHTENEAGKSGSAQIFSKKMEFSYLRAQSVADVMIQNGIPSHNISALGFVDALPSVPQGSTVNQREHRRVVIKLIPED